MTGRGRRDDGADDDNVVPLPLSDPDLAGLFGLDEDDEEFLRQWDEADREAAELVREALPEVMAAAPPRDALRAAATAIRAGVAGRDWPHRHIAAAAGWPPTPPRDDVELWLSAAAVLVAMREESGMGAEAEAALMTLEHADWLGAVVGLVRAGVGSRAEPADLVGHVDDTPEVDGYIDPDDASLVEGAFELILPAWEAVGALDDRRRLTPLGWWGLPRALVWAWNCDPDDEDRSP